MQTPHPPNTHKQTWLYTIRQFLIYMATFGLSPRYATRFNDAVHTYASGYQTTLWRSFIEQVQRERINANVIVSGFMPHRNSFLQFDRHAGTT
jgi:hypothetical protein